MAVQIFTHNSNFKYPEATHWIVNEHGISILDNLDAEIAFHGTFIRIEKVIDGPKINEMLSVSKELIETVDDGSWNKQTVDWKDQAEDLIDVLKKYLND